MYTYMLYDASGAPAATVELCSNRDACLYEYIHTYIHPSIHTYIHTSIHPYIHTCTKTGSGTCDWGTVCTRCGLRRRPSLPASASFTGQG